MNTQQLNRTSTTSLTQPPLVLTDLSQMLSSQGVLLQPKSKQEVMQAFECSLKQTESIIDYQHVRLLQGGIEVQLFVVSSLAVELLANNSQQQRAPISPQLPIDDARAVLTPSQKQPEEAAESRKMIEGAIHQIFQYKRFREDSVMAESALQTLNVVCQACQAWMRERGLETLETVPTEQDKASVLRKFLTKCLDDNLCPEAGKAVPENLSKSAIRDEWVEYLILRWQYIDGERRNEVIGKLQNHHYEVTDGSMYTRRLRAGRKRFASVIWQKEIQAQKALNS